MFYVSSGEMLIGVWSDALRVERPLRSVDLGVGRLLFNFVPKHAEGQWWPQVTVMIRTLPMALLAAVLPGAWLMIALRRGRRALPPGMCTECGYDLRASQLACPECGKPIVPNAAKPLPPPSPESV
ncbi:MAG: hypothetical protein NTW19_15160 [Planctomycetota bacterium]|nr:hypothetical protein [Planctomycetota bacterium]